MRRITVIVMMSCLSGAALYAGDPSNGAEAEVKSLHGAYEAKYRPLWQEAEAARWEALSKGTAEAYDRYRKARVALVELHHDREVFDRLSALVGGGEVTDPLQHRLLKVMYLAFEPAQADLAILKRIVELEVEIERIFHTHRAHVGDEKLTANEVTEILRTTRDPARAEAVWKAYMSLGEKVADRFRALVDLRNAQAHELEHESYFHMSMPLQEIGKKGLFLLFNHLHLDTRDEFARLKGKIDKEQAARFGISESQLRPWHYGDLFFEGMPGRLEADYETFFKDVDPVAASKKYFAGFGLPVEDILQAGDLKVRPEKWPYPVTVDLNRKGEVRILADLQPDVYGPDTLFTELSHALYYKHIDDDVPFILRSPPHGIPLEAVAMMFRDMTRTDDWLVHIRKMDPADAARESSAARDRLRKDQLIFSEWAQVLVRFEHGIYAKPQRNFAEFWHELRKTHQLLDDPDGGERPVYAAEAYIATKPLYYHSFQMGAYYAASLRQRIAKEIVPTEDPLALSIYGHPEAGKWLEEKVFRPGNLRSWTVMALETVGDFGPSAFKEQTLGPTSSAPSPHPQPVGP